MEFHPLPPPDPLPPLCEVPCRQLAFALDDLGTFRMRAHGESAALLLGALAEATGGTREEFNAASPADVDLVSDPKDLPQSREEISWHYMLPLFRTFCDGAGHLFCWVSARIAKLAYDRRGFMLNGLMLRALVRKLTTPTGMGTLLHGALLYRQQGDAIALLGESTAGKSTAARRFPPELGSMACDDMMLLTRKGPELIAHPLPTWSRWVENRPAPRVAFHPGLPLRQVWVISPGPQVAAAPLAVNQRQLSWLKAQTLPTQFALEDLPALWKRAWGENVTGWTGELDRRFPLRNLQTTIDGPYWELLDR